MSSQLGVEPSQTPQRNTPSSACRDVSVDADLAHVIWPRDLSCLLIGALRRRGQGHPRGGPWTLIKTSTSQNQLHTVSPCLFSHRLHINVSVASEPCQITVDTSRHLESHLSADPTSRISYNTRLPPSLLRQFILLHGLRLHMHIMQRGSMVNIPT